MLFPQGTAAGNQADLVTCHASLVASARAQGCGGRQGQPTRLLPAHMQKEWTQCLCQMIEMEVS